MPDNDQCRSFGIAVTNHLGTISAEVLKKAHAIQESGRAIGKNVLDGFNSTDITTSE